MNTIGFIFLIITQFLAGRGLLGLFGIKQRPLMLFVLSLMNGIVIFSLIPMIIQLFNIPITKSNIVIAICVSTVLLNIFPARKYDFSIFKLSGYKAPIFRPYEVLFITLFIALMIPSFWRCFYYPPFARDVLSGPEPLAFFAIKEGKFNNSIFTVNLNESAPNILKPPFLTDLLIIYKLLVHSFGQIWLSLMVSSFMIWLYSLLREKIHPLIACVVLLFFIAIPEMYGYTYIILWDYSNMIFFFIGYYFLYSYTQTKKYGEFLFSCVLFGFATFIRLETLIFVAAICILPLISLWHEHVKIPKLLLNGFLLMVIPFIFYFIWVHVFVEYYLPVHMDDIQHLNFSTTTGYFEWLSQINSELIFHPQGVFYGDIVYFFLVVLIADAVFFRSFNNEARFMLYAIAVVYLVLPALTYFTEFFNIMTAKRGVFKLFPFMLMYMRNSALFLKLSDAIRNFEFPEMKPVKVPGANISSPQQIHPNKKNKK